MAYKKNSTSKPLPRETLISFRQTMYSSKMLGEKEELVPFAWRQPLKLEKLKRPTKYFKAVMLSNKLQNK